MPAHPFIQPAPDRALGLGLTIAFHIGAGFLLLSLAQPVIQQMLAPPMYASLVTAPAKEEVQPEAPKPLPMKAKPQPRQPVQPKPQPVVQKLIQSSDASPAPTAVVAAPPEAIPSPPQAQAAPNTGPVTTAEPQPFTAARHDADYLHNPKPPYPRASTSLGEEGKVWLRVQVSPEGKPLQVLIDTSSGFARLDRSAVNTVASEWRFEPARQGKTPVTGWVRFAIHFELNR